MLQSLRHLAVALVALASALWLAAIVLAPAALALPADAPAPRWVGGGALAVHLAGRQVCHQRPDRSFRVHGRAMPVCARCTGLYAGATAGFAAAAWPWVRRQAGRHLRPLLLAAALPTLASVGLEWVAGWTSAEARAAAAGPLGAAGAIVVALALLPAAGGRDRSATLP